MYVDYINTDIHPFYFGIDALGELVFSGFSRPTQNQNTTIPVTLTGVPEHIKNQFTEYFAGNRSNFVVPYKLEGTDFQRSVWNALKTVSFGKTISYQELGALIGKPKASRAVGNAVAKNPLAIIVPCHRVIHKNGDLGNYSLHKMYQPLGTKIKQFLLNLEKEHV